MGDLTTLEMIAFTFTPMVLTIALIALVGFIRRRSDSQRGDGPERILSAAIHCMPPDRNEWGDAMMAELIHLHEHGQSFRWCFALGCVRAALFPPATTSRPRYAFDAVRRLGSPCAILGVALPTIALPLLWLTSIACSAFMQHDNFSSGEPIPTLLAAAILTCLAIMLSGVPLGIAALVRREKLRWLSCLGPALSVGIFAYLQLIQHLATN